jgi:hypothetical protein
VTQDEKVPDEYIQRNNALAEKQLVFGGLRLANIIAQIYGKSSKKIETTATDLFLQ